MAVEQYYAIALQSKIFARIYSIDMRCTTLAEDPVFRDTGGSSDLCTAAIFSPQTHQIPTLSRRHRNFVVTLRELKQFDANISFWLQARICAFEVRRPSYSVSRPRAVGPAVAMTSKGCIYCLCSSLCRVKSRAETPDKITTLLMSAGGSY